jgi:predicted RNase H-like nuclease (RuvC/YqgF family)
MNTFFRTAIAVSICIALFQVVTYGQSAITYKEYEEQLASAQQREKTAKEEIAQEQAKIESTKQQIAELEQKLADVQKEKYALLGITEQDVTMAETEISSIKSDLERLLSLTPEDLLKRKSEISALERRIAAVKAKPVAYLWKIADGINGLAQLVDQLKSRMQMAGEAAKPVSDKATSYTVKLVPDNRECLYRISGYDVVFGDPAKWPYLYRANQSIIDRGYNRFKERMGSTCKYARAADLIFPGQVLDIPR